MAGVARVIVDVCARRRDGVAEGVGERASGAGLDGGAVSVEPSTQRTARRIPTGKAAAGARERGCRGQRIGRCNVSCVEAELVVIAVDRNAESAEPVEQLPQGVAGGVRRQVGPEPSAELRAGGGAPRGRSEQQGEREESVARGRERDATGRVRDDDAGLANRVQRDARRGAAAVRRGAGSRGHPAGCPRAPIRAITARAMGARGGKGGTTTAGRAPRSRCQPRSRKSSSCSAVTPSASA